MTGEQENDSWSKNSLNMTPQSHKIDHDNPWFLELLNALGHSRDQMDFHCLTCSERFHLRVIAKILGELLVFCVFVVLLVGVAVFVWRQCIAPLDAFTFSFTVFFCISLSSGFWLIAASCLLGTKIEEEDHIIERKEPSMRLRWRGLQCLMHWCLALVIVIIVAVFVVAFLPRLDRLDHQTGWFPFIIFECLMAGGFVFETTFLAIFCCLFVTRVEKYLVEWGVLQNRPNLNKVDKGPVESNDPEQPDSDSEFPLRFVPIP